MVVLNFGDITINTDGNNFVHKEEIEKHTHFYCEEDEPKQWFALDIDGEHRFVYLYYTDDGSKLIKVTSWDKTERTTKMVKVRIGEDKCYFTKNMLPDEYEMVEETDYSSPISKNHQTIWERPRNWWGTYQ